MPPKTYSVASNKLEQVRSAFKKLNQTQQAFADFQAVSRLTFISFLQGKAVTSDFFVKLCEALGFDNWQDIAGLDDLPYPSHNLRRSGAERFIGRDDEVTALHQMLCSDNKTSISQISGMPGVGKTELALQYAYKHITKDSAYIGGICFINARGGKEKIGLDIISTIEAKFKLKVATTVGRKKLTLAERVQWCWEHWISKERTLIIFDDVADFINIEEYLPLVLTQFKLLLTTRINLLVANAQVLSLSTLKPGKALELLLYISRGLEPKEYESISLEQLEQAKDLCSWLGHLPLGIELVSMYIRIHPDISFAQMLRNLNEQKIEQEALNEKYHGMTANLNLLAAFELSWKDLDDISLEIAYCIGLFSPYPFYWSLAENILCSKDTSTSEISDHDKNILANARDNYLLNYNLLKRIEDGIYQIHGLLCEFYRYKLKRFPLLERDLTRRWYQTLSTVGIAISSSQSLSSYELSKEHLPHFEEAVSSMTTEIFTASKHSKTFGFIFTSISNLYSLVGSHFKAEQYLKQYLDLVKFIDSGCNVHAARALLHLGFIFKTLGKFPAAIKYFGEAQLICNKLYVISLYPSLKKTILLLDDEALRSLVSTELETKMGEIPKDFDGLFAYGLTFEVLVNNASVYFLAGQIEVAEETFLTTLPVFSLTESFSKGVNSPSQFYLTASSVDGVVGLARIYSKQNKFEEALTLLLRARRILEPFGSTELNVYVKGLHPGIMILKMKGFPARDIWQIIESYTNVLDALGDYYKYQRNYVKAVELYKDSEAIRGRERMLLGTASSYFNLASVLIAQDLTEGKFILENSARTLDLNTEALLIKSLKIRTDNLAKEHYLVGLIMLYLGQVYELKGDKQEARLNFAEGIRIMRLTFSDNHFVLEGWLKKIQNLKYWDCL
ncbi:MAG: tetratricopeptide repeat protein [Pegethrix bostrychoides GSE-TBD4-15B]|jgi:hypothetical protein|uniref:Tetratricopeptide repeat protein n=1 Tax=Pegethrix bostrychoides GSE-TBD4-15B TaxID=2839662 RepID=A0A951P8Q1_9CYAN|nr:tetratricopeptide repeat protein [Pegethrix bostrychoides GSE-TBD4-15B]